MRQTQLLGLFPKTAIKKAIGLFVASSVYHKTKQGKNSFCIQSKYYVKIASDFEPPPRRKKGARKRAEFGFLFGGFPCGFWENFWRNTVGVPSARPRIGSFRASKFYSGAFILPYSNLFPKSLNERQAHARSTW